MKTNADQTGLSSGEKQDLHLEGSRHAETSAVLAREDRIIHPCTPLPKTQRPLLDHRPLVLEGHFWPPSYPRPSAKETETPDET